jgi:hypothetical protein
VNLVNPLTIIGIAVTAAAAVCAVLRSLGVAKRWYDSSARLLTACALGVALMVTGVTLTGSDGLHVAEARVAWNDWLPANCRVPQGYTGDFRVSGGSGTIRYRLVASGTRGVIRTLHVPRSGTYRVTGFYQPPTHDLAASWSAQLEVVAPNHTRSNVATAHSALCRASG